MATVSITIPDAIVPRVTAALRARFPDYSALTDANAFRAIIAQHVRDVVIDYEATRAQQTAATSVQTQITQTTTDVAGIA